MNEQIRGTKTRNENGLIRKGKCPTCGRTYKKAMGRKKKFSAGRNAPWPKNQCGAHMEIKI